MIYINHKKNEKPRDNRQLELTSDLAIFTLQNNRKLRERIEDLEKNGNEATNASYCLI